MYIYIRCKHFLFQLMPKKVKVVILKKTKLDKGYTEGFGRF